jgi:outer membrane protein
MSKPTRPHPSIPAVPSRLRVLGAVIAVSSVGWLPATAIAQQAGAKIGFVSTERIMKDANPAKAAQAKIEQDFARRDKELQDLNTRLRSASEKLDKEAAVLAESDRVRRQREIAEMDRDFQRRQREFREDLNQRRNEELAAVLEKANRAIKEIAEREKFDLILQEAVFVSPRMDITEQVVKLLNAGK